MTTDNKAQADRLIEAAGQERWYGIRNLLREAAAALTSPQADKARGEVFDFAAHLARQRQWSETTFGPGARTAGVIDHIRKELREVEAAPEDGEEWVDVVILALDGAWRSGLSPDQIIAGIVAKQAKNEGRVWPDWRTADPNKAIEHERTGDWKAGDLVRYDAGETALAELVTPHAGGWHARQCMGGPTLISEDWRRKFYPLTPDDRATWERCAKHRRPTTTPQPQGDAIPRLANCGRYQATDNTGQTYYLNHANEWQTFQGTQQVSGDGFTAADMMDARAEERARLSGLQVSGGGEALAVAAAMLRIAPTCESDWDEQLREWASRLSSTPQAQPSCDCGSSEGNREPHHDECALLANEQARPDGGSAS